MATQLIDLGPVRFVWRGVWDSTLSYSLNDVVRYGSSLYIYTAASAATNVTPTTTANWAVMLPAGGVSFTAGTLANRPSPSLAGAVYLISGDADAGVIYQDTGTAWVIVGRIQHLLKVLASAIADVPLTVSGVTGQTGDLTQWQSVPGTNVARVTPLGRFVPPVAPRKTLTYDGTTGLLTTVTLASADGSTTIETTTLTYNSSQVLTQSVTVSDGRTVTRVFTYDGNGRVTQVTEVQS